MKNEQNQEIESDGCIIALILVIATCMIVLLGYIFFIQRLLDNSIL